MMGAQFSPDFFKRNREKLRSISENVPIVLTANGVLQRNGDVTYPFRQDSSFWYLTGVEKPDVILVLDKKGEYLIIPERDDVIKKFDGDDDTAKLSQVSGIKEVVAEKEGWNRLSHRLSETHKIATLSASPSYVERHGLYTNPARARLIERLEKVIKDLDIEDLRPQLVRMRAIKQPEELEAIEEAIELTTKAMLRVYRKREEYDFEYEAEADITSTFREAGNNHAFPPIVASGKNGCTIHHVDNNGPIDGDGLLIVDIGAEVTHYAADITRTIAIEEPTKRQQAIFDAVKDVQAFAMGELKPGVRIKEYEGKVEKYMGKKLQELGLIKTIEKAEVRKYFPHGTSHFLGLDTHDVGEYDKPLEPGMVLTVEPGIYIPEEGIGVRIEDDVLITEDGIKNLSEKLPVKLI